MLNPGRPLLSLSQGAPPSSLSSLLHMVELRSGRRVENEEISSASGARVDTSRGRTLERLEAPAPPAPPPPRIRELRNPAKAFPTSSDSPQQEYYSQSLQVDGAILSGGSQQFQCH
ncbi:hypothetical protein Taro_044264 [Colocasia esculenta]|uniref:Uncharacterized protein n=1 Tax=Colocasia esculenta TaxID=4460 RepID=A0A843WTK9_COLES|nr:hypothetical protein [Colocasia esculenta]